MNRGVRYWGGMILLAAGLSAGLFASLMRKSGSSQDHVPIVQSRAQAAVTVQICAECHAEIVASFASAPHGRTLHRGDEPEILARFAGRSFQFPGSSTRIEFHADAGKLSLTSSTFAQSLPVDWIFGSGTHAQTPLILWNDARGQTSAIEHSVSWYAGGQIAATLGMDGLKASVGGEALGRHWGTAETANCFGCHATYVPAQEGQIDFDHLQPNIGCVRCHFDAATHARGMAGGAETKPIERFAALTPAESVFRCGECHRRAGELGGELKADDPTIVRFASVGLPQSPCFQRQAEVTLANGKPARLDCTTCHDPHRPTEQDWRNHTRVCLECHDSAQGRAIDCTHAPRTENCLKCHMPAVPSNDFLNFTDHWIRVR